MLRAFQYLHGFHTNGWAQRIFIISLTLYMSKLPTDNDLITRLSNGDKQALYAIYDRYAPALHGVILRMCRNQVLAEDLLQESS